MPVEMCGLVMVEDEPEVTVRVVGNEMEIIGVRDEKEFVIRLWSPENLLQDDQIIYRSYFDFFHLSKTIPSPHTSLPTNLLQFPSTHCKKLLQFGDWDLGINWNPFLTKSLNILNHWLQNLQKSFPMACHNFSNELIFLQERMERKERKELESSARLLQQYFMSEANMDLVITETLRCRHPHPHHNSLFIEPSCGDGRLLRKLIQSLSPVPMSPEEPQERKEMGSSCSVVGCDIDPNIVKRCLQVSGKETEADCSPNGLQGKIHIGNFLETSLETFITMMSSSLQTPPPPQVIVFGGPPYTFGGGTGELSQSGDALVDTGRDLPLQFIVHSAVALKAHAIIFLLPVRCQNEQFIQRCKSLIEDQQHNQQRSREVESENESSPPSGKQSVEWVVSSISPPNNEFDFCSRIIRQPVIIQIWERR